MHKILVVARTEFANAVRTKAFLFSLLMLPVIYGIMILAQVYANKADTQPRHFAVVDRTGKLFPAIKEAAEGYNKSIVNEGGKPTAPTFLPTAEVDGTRTPEETALALSERVRSGELYAFVEIPADAIDAKAASPVMLKYYSDNPNYGGLRAWLDAVVGAQARTVRYKAAGIDPALLARIDRPVVTENLGLATRAAPAATTPPVEGQEPQAKPVTIVAGQKIDPIRTMAVPAALAIIVYLITLTQAPQLVSTVMEEKMSRISEMLLGSLSPFELMMGKLLGNAATALLTTSLYLSAAYIAASRYGYADAVTPGVLVTLVLMVTLSIFLFGSLYMAVGSSCSELKDAQSLMMPVMMLSICPVFILGPVLTNPSGSLAVVSSLIPFATPILMTTRMAMIPAPPAWQVGLSIVLTALTAIACVWASGKIFRTGLLMHGKAPSFRQMVKWVMAR